jgi:hypothetical protein
VTHSPHELPAPLPHPPGVPAALTSAQKSSTSREGGGDVAARWVNRMPVTPLRGLERHAVSVPPSHPTLG